MNSSRFSLGLDGFAGLLDENERQLTAERVVGALPVERLEALGHNEIVLLDGGLGVDSAGEGVGRGAAGPAETVGILAAANPTPFAFTRAASQEGAR